MTRVATDKIFDVAIVGLGPVGAILANLLGQQGLEVVVFEREPEIVISPRAVALDGEIMRVIQAIGLAEKVEPRLRPSLGAQFIDPDGQLLLERPAAEAIGAQGWRSFYTFHQPDLEALLREGLTRFPKVEVRLDHELLAVEASVDHVGLTIDDRSGHPPLTVRARYLVGCDGARSLVRPLIGPEMEDLGLHEPWVVADFVLTGPAALPELSTQYCDPDDPVTFVRIIDDRRRFEFKLRPGEDALAAATPAAIWRRAAPWITPRNAQIVRAAPYTFHSLIATRWRRGRLLIAGDAAHQTPPFLGQGLCAGVRDASNLAWKLAAVVRDGAPDALLDTYGSERIPHVRVFIDLAVRIGRVLSAATPAKMFAAAGGIGAGGGEALIYPTPTLGDGVFDAGFRGGRVSSQPFLADGRRLDAAIGGGFGLVVAAGQHDAYLARHSEPGEPGPLTAVRASGGAQDWLTSLDASFAILRPDRYLFAIGRGDPQLSAMLERLSQSLGRDVSATSEASR